MEVAKLQMGSLLHKSLHVKVPWLLNDFIIECTFKVHYLGQVK